MEIGHILPLEGSVEDSSSGDLGRETALSRVLSIDDLVLCIASQFDYPILCCTTEEDYDEFIENKRTLHSLALTSKAFASPALDILWRNMDSLIPLVKLLSFVKVQVDTGEVSVGTVARYDLDNDWARFNLYSPRVHALRIHSRSMGRFLILRELYFYSTLSTLRSGTSFLPNIHTLILEHLPTPEQANQLTALLMSSSLITLVLHDTVLKAVTEHADNLMALVCFKCPHLRRLDFVGCSGKSSLFTANTPPPSALASISIMGSGLSLNSMNLWATGLKCELTKLSLGSCSFISTWSTFHPRDTYTNWKMFPGKTCRDLYKALETVEITAPLSLLQTFFGYISSNNLQNAVIKVVLTQASSSSSSDQGVLAPHNQCMEFIADITDRWSHTLESLQISFDGASGSTSLFKQMPAQVFFEPFLKCSNLRALRFFNFPKSLSGALDYTLLHHILSLPRLESLHLPPHEQGLPIFKLRNLLDFHPDVRDLGISLDFQDAMPSSTLNHKLTKLKVFGSCPSNIVRTARQLDDIFPRLVQLTGVTDKPRWEEVQELLHLCQHARCRTG